MTTNDPGPAFVAAVRDALMVDEAFAVPEPRGFSWWPHRLRQRIAADEPSDGGGTAACRVRIETEVLLAGPDEAKGAATLTELLRFPPLAAFFCDGSDGRIRLVSALTASADAPPHLAPLAAVVASVQATYAELGLDSLAAETGLAAAASDHPASGRRPHPDGMLNLAAARILPAGQGASRWASPEGLFEAAGEPSIAALRPAVDPRGFNVRFALRTDVSDPLAPRHSALLQVRVDAPHPELGSGVFLRLYLPTAGQRPSPEGAMRLNALERAGDADAPDALGAWTLERSEPEITGFAVEPAPPRFCHVTFLPNFVKVPGLLREAVLGELRRARRAAASLGLDG